MPGSTQTIVQSVAVSQIVLSSILLIWVALILILQAVTLDKSVFADDVNVYNGTSSEPTDSNQDKIEVAIVKLIATVFLFLFATICLIVDTNLYRGASKRDIGKCRIWRTIRYIRLAAAVTICVRGLYKEQPECFLLISLASIGIDLMCIWVVQVFINELKSEQQEHENEEWKPQSTKA